MAENYVTKISGNEVVDKGLRKALKTIKNEFHTLHRQIVSLMEANRILARAIFAFYAIFEEYVTLNSNPASNSLCYLYKKRVQTNSNEGDYFQASYDLAALIMQLSQKIGSNYQRKYDNRDDAFTAARVHTLVNNLEDFYYDNTNYTKYGNGIAENIKNLHSTLASLPYVEVESVDNDKNIF